MLGAASVTLWLGASLGIVPWSVEPVYILLSAFWFAAVGHGARQTHRAFSTFSWVLAAATLVDAGVTFADVYIAAGAPKLLLQLPWLVWLGLILVREPVGGTPNAESSAGHRV